jgi:hypothetical protein
VNPESRELLDLVRDAEDPRPEDERRVLAAVRVAVAGGAAAGAGLSVAKLAKLLGAWSAPTAKGVVIVGLLVAAGGVAAWPEGEGAPVAPAPPASPRVAPPTSEPVVTSAPIEVPIPEASAAVAGKPAPAAIVRAGSPAAAPLPAPSLRDELALLAEVQATLKRGDGEAALRRLDEHVTTDEQLLAERDAARILALCAAGRATEAREAAGAFVLRHPASPQRAAVAGACSAPQPASD